MLGKPARAIRHDEDLSSHEEAIHNAFLEKIETRLECWQIHQQLKRHAPFFAEAIDSYRNEKWASCFSVAIPRIEGMLRDAFQLNTIKSSVLLDALGTELRNREHERSLLFPDQLLKFCQKNIYPTTPFDNPDLPSTRHTALHGVVDYSKITRKCALTTLLLVDHLLYCMPLVDSATKGNAETDET